MADEPTKQETAKMFKKLKGKQENNVNHPPSRSHCYTAHRH